MAEPHEHGGGEEVPCPPEEIVFDPRTGSRICKRDGRVIDDLVPTEEAEWRAYTAEERLARTRVGAPLSLSEPNMGATADMVRRPGSRLPSRGPHLRRRGLFGHPSSSIDRNVNQALAYIREIVRKKGFPPEVEQEAARIYREAAARGLTRGRSIEIMAAAAVYAACRIVRNVTCTLEEIASLVRGREGEVKREVGRCFRLLVKDLGLKIPVIRPEAYVSRIVSALGLPDEIVPEAIRIIEIAKKKGLTAGKDPSGLAAAAVYLAAQRRGFRKTQKEVANVAGVTEVTVRNRYKEISKVLSEAGLA